MNIMARAEPVHALRYSEVEAPRPPRSYRAVGTASVVAGLLGVGVNFLVGLTMLGQLYKQWEGRGASRMPIEPWLMTGGAAAIVGMVLAGFAVVAGMMTLHSPVLGPSLHRTYAWVKLPLACVVAGCTGWGVVFYVSREPQVIAAAAALALVVGAAYPLLLLRIFRPNRNITPARFDTAVEPAGIAPHAAAEQRE